MEPLLEVRDLGVRYPGAGGEIVAVDGMSFTIAPSEVVGLAGPSGCGKSSVALAIPGLLPPAARRSGTIRFRGRRLDTLAEPDLRRLRGAEIGCIFQEPALALHPTIRVGEQIAEVLRAHGRKGRRHRRDAARTLLAEVGLAGDVADAYPHQLSGGQRQRVVLCQALACRPALVLADEPTASLDHELEAEILELMRRLRDRFGAAFLLISHDSEVLAEFADRVLRMPGEGASGSVSPLSRPPEERGRGGEDGKRGDVVEVKNLSKTYRRGALFGRGTTVRALDRVSLEIPERSIVALVGPSGSGKSTLARCLALLEEPDDGEIRLAGRDLRPLAEREKRAVRPRLQLLFQDPAAALDPRFSAIEAVVEPLLVRGCGDRGCGDRESREARALALMAEVGLGGELARRRVQALSGGQKRRLTLARALAAEPRLLILDEGLSGIDAALRAQILELLFALRERHASSYLLISHDRRLVAGVADRTVELRAGRIG